MPEDEFQQHVFWRIIALNSVICVFISSPNSMQIQA